MNRRGLTFEVREMEMTRAVVEAVEIPVIAFVGAGKLQHPYETVTVGKASAVLAAPIFHLGEISISQAKEYLADKGISVRV